MFTQYTALASGMTFRDYTESRGDLGSIAVPRHALGEKLADCPIVGVTQSLVP